MLKFRLKPEVFKISLAHKYFDDSEFGDVPKVEREKVIFEMFPLGMDLIERITEDNTTVDIETYVRDGGRRQERIDKVDNKQVQKDIIDKIIINWSGVLGPDNSEIPCTKENKFALMSAYPRLAARWVNVAMDAMAKLDQFAKEKKEATRKNSKTSQSGQENAETM